MTIDPSLLVTIGGSLLAFAAAWGVIKASVRDLKDKVHEHDGLIRDLYRNSASPETVEAIQKDIRTIQEDIKSILMNMSRCSQS